MSGNDLLSDNTALTLDLSPPRPSVYKTTESGSRKSFTTSMPACMQAFLGDPKFTNELNSVVYNSACIDKLNLVFYNSASIDKLNLVFYNSTSNNELN